jgi:hypothetical protein
LGVGQSGAELFVAVCVGQEAGEEALHLGTSSSGFRQHYHDAPLHDEDMTRFIRITVHDYLQPRVALSIDF